MHNLISVRIRGGVNVLAACLILLSELYSTTVVAEIFDANAGIALQVRETAQAGVVSVTWQSTDATIETGANDFELQYYVDNVTEWYPQVSTDESSDNGIPLLIGEVPDFFCFRMVATINGAGTILGYGTSGNGPPCAPDLDNDGIPDYADPDDDNDGIPDISDPDDDNDGVPDAYDLATDPNVRMFYDVDGTNLYRHYIEALAFHGITSGCGNDNYCPNNPVTREQMAVFLLRGIHGSSYFPPAIAQSRFNDVDPNHWAAPWIERLAVEGVTSGCGNNNYCPKVAVTRAQMAVFLLRSKYGAGFFPPAIGSSAFNDVPLDNPFAAWIAKLAADGVTSGCAVNLFCPDASVTRAQMAVFLVRTFGLPLYFTPLAEAAVMIQSSQPAEMLVLEAAGGSDGTGGTVPAASHYLTQAELPGLLQDRLTDAGASAGQPFSSADGLLIVFASESSILVPGDTNDARDIFLYDVAADHLQRVSVDSQGNQADGASTWARMDGMGQTVVFSSEATNLAAVDSNGVSDIFSRDLRTGETRRISLDPGPGAEPNPARHPAIDGSGTEIVYDRGGNNRQIHLHNLLYGAGDVLTDAIDLWGEPVDSHHPGISPDGRYIVFLRNNRDAVKDTSDCHVVRIDRKENMSTEDSCAALLDQLEEPAPVIDPVTNEIQWIEGR